MAKKSLQQVIKQNKQLGFDPAIIQFAYNNVNGDADRVIQQIFRLQNQSNSYPTKPSNPQDQDAQLSKAIEMSITQAKDKKISLQPLNPQQRVRKSGVPVGLKNIGNTCYFNSLLQTYFQNATFVREILRYEIPEKYRQLSKQQIQKRSQEDFQFKRKFASCKLVESLKNLFAQMIGSDRKYIDPTSVLSSIVDDYGNQLPVGDQKDIGEFNLIFLSRIDEGLSQLYAKQKMEIEQAKQQYQQSPSKLKVVGNNSQQNFPEGSTLSLLKHSSIKLTQSSVVSQQFIGKISNSFHNESQHFHKQQQQLFSLLFVNVKYKQLYQALQEVVISHIDDYRNDKGQVVGVQKRTWIKQAPKTLFFQIDRVVFDKERATLQKINDIFQFPKQFYIDPFLNKNKDKALQIQKRVKKLRAQKQKFLQYLDQLQNYGKDKQNLLNTIVLTSQFLQSQTNKMQVQTTRQEQKLQPLAFPNLQQNIKSEFLQILRNYANQIQKKQSFYKQRIQKIEKEIQNCYQEIRTQPYYLYSILIHQGSAEMGHYYSYVYDIQNNIWRKYNDINISEETQQQVFKQARGINATSAYYLVYAQKDVMIPLSSHSPVKSYLMSTDQNYMKDYYSSFLSQKMRAAITTQNHTMYSQIDQYKMGSFATRVVDSYAKKFQICNQTFRKNKPQKKKNCPPLLINLPLYIKFNDQNEYKNALIQNCIQQYGPKQYNPAFEQILGKKMSNFNDHKKPKQWKSKEHNLNDFMQDIYHAIAARMIFQAIKQSSYDRIFSLMKDLQNTPPGNYFNWLSNLLGKILVVHLLIEAEQQIPVNPESALGKLKLMAFLLLRIINLDQEKILYNNCIFWLAQIGIMFKQQNLKARCDQINAMITSKNYKGEFDELFINKQTQKTLDQIKGSVQIADASWNLSRTEDVYINQMLAAREAVKQKIEASNQMYRQMKKYNLPLQKNARQNIINKKK